MLSFIFSSLLAIDVQTPSRLTALSDSVMRHPAINDVTSNDYTQESDHSCMCCFLFFLISNPLRIWSVDKEMSLLICVIDGLNSNLVDPLFCICKSFRGILDHLCCHFTSLHFMLVAAEALIQHHSTLLKQFIDSKPMKFNWHILIFEFSAQASHMFYCFYLFIWKLFLFNSFNW